MTDGTGTTLLKWVGVENVRRRVCHWLPRREKWYRLEWGPVWSLIHWRPYWGLWRVAVGDRGDPNGVKHSHTPRSPTVPIKKRTSPVTPDLPPIPLGATSMILAKLPALREFIAATSYSDGSTRLPGYFTLRNRGNAYELTVYDPDGGARLPVRADTIDGVLSLTEQLLGTENAPWEHDQYLQDQLLKRKKRKK